MKLIFKLAAKSLWSRRVGALLTSISIALAIALFVSVDRLRQAAESGFTSSISQVDLLVGARSSPLNLLLYSVFNIGSATNNVSIESYNEFKNHPAVAWTIPYSLGDSHRGFRVVGTNQDFYEHYRFRGDKKLEFSSGGFEKGIWGVVLGADVASTLNYKLGDSVVVTHGVTRGEGLVHHDDKPFKVVGILKKTGTALDRSLYVTLEGLEAVHIDWKSGGQPRREEMIAQEAISADMLEVKQITSFFLRTKSRLELLALQREINTYVEEPLMAIIPGAVLAELWRALGFVEGILKAISWLVIFVGVVSMLIILLTSLNERRREMAVLRSVGASPSHIVQLLVVESVFLAVTGMALGFVLHFVAFALFGWAFESQFGLKFSEFAFSTSSFFGLIITLIAAVFAGLIPGYLSMKRALKDGLSPKI
jgi:putative ABC transport system permease protein